MIQCFEPLLFLQSELNDWGRNPPEGCCLESCEPMTHWVVLMAGPEAAAGMPRLYEGETFR
jgi:ubiquitin-conjugating enzyme E2 W/release factor glutamine methyltransferase